MKEFLTDRWHVKMVLFPYGPKAIRIYEKQPEGYWQEVSNRYYCWDEFSADRDYAVLCRMLSRKEEEVEQAAGNHV